MPMTTETGQHGGARPNSGRKRGQRLDDHARLLKSRADKEAALARIRQADADEREGRLLKRDEVIQGWATLIRRMAAELDQLPVLMKRNCPDLTHTHLLIVEQTIAKMCNQLSEEFQKHGNQ